MKTQFNLVTQWIAEDGTQHTGSDERPISNHETFADAKLAMEKLTIRHPHNHAEIIEVDTPAPESPFTEKRWDHPSLWKGIKQGTCTDCKNGPHILRNGLCWTCEQENSATANIN